MLRHPSYQGLREDKKASSVVREATVALPTRKRVGRSTARDDHAEVAGIAISHPDRVVFPDPGATKLDLAQYYEVLAEHMLPHLRGRPLSLLRCPAGTAAKCFFQKHFGPGELKSLRRIEIEEHKGRVQYVMARNAPDLVALAQAGIVELHPWGSRADDLGRPDRLIFDLDPAPGVTWARVIETALALKERLEYLDLVSFVKTTGGKGLHVVVPLQRRALWQEAKEFARSLATRFVEAAPSLYTVSPLKRSRTGKIFIDYLRNDRGSTAVAPYSVRARPGAPVAMPIRWDEVTPDLRPEAYTLKTVPSLIARCADPWRNMPKRRQLISAAAMNSVKGRG